MMELTDGLYHLIFKGFAAAKKCTNEGRALMQLDFRQFVIQVNLELHSTCNQSWTRGETTIRSATKAF